MSIDIDSSDRSWKLRYFLFRKKKDKHMYKVKGHWVGDHGTIDYAIGRLKPPLARLRTATANQEGEVITL